MPRTPIITKDLVERAINREGLRIYVVRDTMSLQYVGLGILMVRSYEAVIGVLHIKHASIIEKATICEGWNGFSPTTSRHLRALYDFVEREDIPANVVESRSWR